MPTNSSGDTWLQLNKMQLCVPVPQMCCIKHREQSWYPWLLKLYVLNSQLQTWLTYQADLKQMTQTQMTKFCCQGYREFPWADSWLTVLTGSRVYFQRPQIWKIFSKYAWTLSVVKNVSVIFRQIRMRDWFQHQRKNKLSQSVIHLLKCHSQIL